MAPVDRALRAVSIQHKSVLVDVSQGGDDCEVEDDSVADEVMKERCDLMFGRHSASPSGFEVGDGIRQMDAISFLTIGPPGRAASS